MLARRGWMLAVAAMLLAVTGVMPQIPVQRNIFEHVVVFDITQSMNVTDQTVEGKPASRLAFAKHGLTQTLDHLPCGSRIGLALFANRRTLLVLAPVEVCANRYELAQAISEVDVRMAWEHASVISRGLYTAVEIAAELPTVPSLVFLTDGHAAPPVPDDELPVFDAPAVPVRGTILGVGGTVPQPIPRSNRAGQSVGWWKADDVVQRPDDPSSREHYSSLREAHLLALAAKTGMHYARLDPVSTLRTALTNEAAARPNTVALDMRWLPALAAGLLLLAFYWPQPGRGKVRSRTVRRAWPSPFAPAKKSP